MQPRCNHNSSHVTQHLCPTTEPQFRDKDATSINGFLGLGIHSTKFVQHNIAGTGPEHCCHNHRTDMDYTFGTLRYSLP